MGCQALADGVLVPQSVFAIASPPWQLLLAEPLLSEPDQHRCIALQRDLHLLPAERYAQERLATRHRLAKALLLAPVPGRPLNWLLDRLLEQARTP